MEDGGLLCPSSCYFGYAPLQSLQYVVGKIVPVLLIHRYIYEKPDLSHF
jgi:hypothetical protein